VLGSDLAALQRELGDLNEKIAGLHVRADRLLAAIKGDLDEEARRDLDALGGNRDRLAVECANRLAELLTRIERMEQQRADLKWRLQARARKAKGERGQE
jgi:chromosome segregation ATPase